MGQPRSGATSARAKLGLQGEAIAGRHLEELGFRILARRHGCRGGEVDLVAEEGDCLCFVEVRTRSAGPVSPLESVNRPKQRRVLTAALHYLSIHGIAPVGERALRFDVVEVEQDANGSLTPRLWRTAFEADE